MSPLPEFILGKSIVVADSLSRSNQVLRSEWTLAQEIFRSLQKRWLVIVDLFATLLSFWLPIYASMRVLVSLGTNAMPCLQDHHQVNAFPPFLMTHPVINSVIRSDCISGYPILATEGMVLMLPGVSYESPHASAIKE